MRRAFEKPPRDLRADQELTGEDAASRSAVRLVAPQRLESEVLGAERDVLQPGPGTLVAVLTGRSIVPAVLHAVVIVRVRDGLFDLVHRHNAVAIEITMTVGVIGRVDVVLTTAGALFRHVRHERVAYAAARAMGALGVIGAVHRAVGCRRVAGFGEDPAGRRAG